MDQIKHRQEHAGHIGRSAIRLFAVKSNQKQQPKSILSQSEPKTDNKIRWNRSECHQHIFQEYFKLRRDQVEPCRFGIGAKVIRA